MNEERPLTRQDRRAGRLRKKKEQMRVHGRNLAKIYRNAILKRQKRQKRRRPRI
jgi:hypothetical protein